MYLSLRNLVVFVALAGLAVGSWYITRVNPSNNVANEPGRRLPPGYYLIDARLLGTNEAGQVVYQISAGRLEERADESGLLLSDVRVDYRPAFEIPWRLTATRGEAPRDQSYLELRGAVRLVSEPENGGTGTMIETQRLTLQPERFVASTDESVSVLMGRTELKATGMKAYLKEDRLELESNVHGQFRP